MSRDLTSLAYIQQPRFSVPHGFYGLVHCYSILNNLKKALAAMLESGPNIVVFSWLGIRCPARLSTVKLYKCAFLEILCKQMFNS